MVCRKYIKNNNYNKYISIYRINRTFHSIHIKSNSNRQSRKNDRENVSIRNRWNEELWIHRRTTISDITCGNI